MLLTSMESNSEIMLIYLLFTLHFAFTVEHFSGEMNPAANGPNAMIRKYV